MLTMIAKQSFWFDTLCIPVKEEHADLKNRSIDTMNSIYAGAKRVLILDAELMATESINTEQSLARVICSIWMCRSWTLQEGILANKCVFQFANKMHIARRFPVNETFRWAEVGEEAAEALEASDIRTDPNLANTPALVLEHIGAGLHPVLPPEPYLTEDKELRDRVRAEALRRARKSQLKYSLERYLLHDFFAIQLSWHKKHERFACVWNALAGRSTTQSTDLCFILANLLGVKCSHLFKLESPEERLQMLIFSLRKIPLSLFFNTGRRYDSDRYHHNRWVPVELSRDLLTSKTMLNFKGACLTFQSLEYGEHRDVSVYIVHEIIPPASKLYSIRMGHAQPCYDIRTFAGDTDAFDTRGMHRTCLILEKEPLRPISQICGAVFYVSMYTKNQRGDELSLIFHAPARVQEALGDQIPPNHERQGHVYTAEVVPESAKIRILYGMCVCVCVCVCVCGLHDFVSERRDSLLTLYLLHNRAEPPKTEDTPPEHRPRRLCQIRVEALQHLDASSPHCDDLCDVFHGDSLLGLQALAFSLDLSGMARLYRTGYSDALCRWKESGTVVVYAILCNLR